jgi:hypothetical protein
MRLACLSSIEAISAKSATAVTFHFPIADEPSAGPQFPAACETHTNKANAHLAQPTDKENILMYFSDTFMINAHHGKEHFPRPVA